MRPEDGEHWIERAGKVVTRRIAEKIADILCKWSGNWAVCVSPDRWIYIETAETAIDEEVVGVYSAGRPFVDLYDKIRRDLIHEIGVK